MYSPLIQNPDQSGEKKEQTAWQIKYKYYLDYMYTIIVIFIEGK